MFILFFPTGLDLPEKRRMTVALVLVAVVLWRLVVGMLFPGTQVQIAAVAGQLALDWPSAAMLLHSFVSPVVFETGVLEPGHQALSILSVMGVLVFWMLYGGALESALGPGGAALAFVVGGLAGFALVFVPGFAFPGTFWIGYAATVFCLGAALALFALTDMRFQYYVFLWIFVTIVDARGRVGVPSVVLLVPLFAAVTAGHSLGLLPPGDPPAGFFRGEGAIGPVTWSLMLAFMGAGFAVLVRPLRPSARSVG